MPAPLPAADLCSGCDAAGLPFDLTTELEPLDEVIGQARAVEAVRFGIDIQRQGFNIFAHGPPGSGKSTTIRHFLDQEARRRPAADDWCYVYNFEQFYRPRALRLPPGRGAVLRDGMAELVEGLLVAMPAALETDAYAARRNVIVAEHTARSHANFEKLRLAAAARGVGVIQGEEGVSLAPLAGDTVMTPEAFDTLPSDAQAELRGRLDQTQTDLDAAARAEQAIQRASQDAIAALDREVARVEIEARLAPLAAAFDDLPEVRAHFQAVQKDILDRLDVFRRQEGGDGEDGAAPVIKGDAVATARARRRADPRLRRYAVNVLVDHAGGDGAPVVTERYPAVANLVGRIEHEQRYGALVTDFTLIKSGALHRANGGFLVIEADELLKQPYSWDAIKRALRHQEVRIEAQADDHSPMTTISLDPEPIPLDCKVILIGDSGLYFGLHSADADLPELFKVGAEFAASMARTADSEALYVRFMAGVALREGLLPFHRTAAARVIEHSARLAGDAHRLSTYFLDVTDLLREADYWARRAGKPAVHCDDVERAIDARVERADLARDRALEAYARHIVLLDVAGSAVGHVNGLTVVSRGNFDFGLPMRITARVRMGGGEVIDIEREVELSGPLHAKGILTLSGYLGGRYVLDDVLAITASLTFEQSYDPVEGDSASSAELLALLSALAELPVKQSLAVTGSVNQAGEVQAIGGVNEKIEGFFDVCREHGLTGEQGVLIPSANVQHLMLRRDVVEAVRAGRFHIFPIQHIDDGLALVTGLPAGERDATGMFPTGTANRRIEDRLRQLAERRRALAREATNGAGSPDALANLGPAAAG